MINTKVDFKGDTMNGFYTDAFSIPSGGWTGGASAIMYCPNGGVNTTGITADITLWRDVERIRMYLNPGVVYPFKVRFINHSASGNTGVVGFN